MLQEETTSVNIDSYEVPHANCKKKKKKRKQFVDFVKRDLNATNKD